jgi:hypothetical protein
LLKVGSIVIPWIYLIIKSIHHGRDERVMIAGDEKDIQFWTALRLLLR